MFDKPTVDSYRRISAPQSLRDKVMIIADTQKPVSRSYSHIISIAAAAACLLLVAVGAILGLPADELAVIYNGAPVTADGTVILADADDTAMFSARTAPPVTINLTVSSEDAADISVSSGFLTVYKDTTAVTSGTNCTADGVFQLEWVVTLMPGQTESLFIGESEYTVSHTNDGISTIRKA